MTIFAINERSKSARVGRAPVEVVERPVAISKVWMRPVIAAVSAAERPSGSGPSVTAPSGCCRDRSIDLFDDVPYRIDLRENLGGNHLVVGLGCRRQVLGNIDQALVRLRDSHQVFLGKFRHR
jgi:hypothetical protein